MKDKQVKLTVEGIIDSSEDEKPGRMRLVTFGRLSRKDEAWKLKYNEIAADSGKHSVTITMDKDVVTMDRLGEFSTSMVFKDGQRHEGLYNTPFGALDMGVFPTKVAYHIDEKGKGNIELKYQLDIEGRFASFHQLNIDITPKPTANA